MSATLKTNVCHLPRYIPGSTPEKCNGSADGYNVSMACENVWTLDIQCLYIHKTVLCKKHAESHPAFHGSFPQASGFQMRIVAKLYSRFFTRSEVSSCHAMTIRQNSIPYAVFNFKINDCEICVCHPIKLKLKLLPRSHPKWKFHVLFSTLEAKRPKKNNFWLTQSTKSCFL